MDIRRVARQVRAGVEAVLIAALLAAILSTVWAYGRARLSAGIYARRIAALASEYERLRQDYNRAVSRTAVTELRVAGGAVRVVVRTADGQVREFATGCRVDHDVYVDYVVLGGRLWIRRVFDSGTAPDAGTLVDPALAGVPWETDTAAVGKAVYRHLDEGRWVVTVTGNGSLGLERVQADTEVTLSPPPAVLDLAALERDLDDAHARITWRDLLQAVLRPPSASL